MNFEFPDEEQYIELQQIDDVDDLKQILNAFKSFYENQNILFYYEIRSWQNTFQNTIEKIGAYCKYCDAKLVYSKKPSQEKFTLQLIQTRHRKHPKADGHKPNDTQRTQSPKKQPERKNHKNQDVLSEKFTTDLYKDFIIYWLVEYEKVLKKHLTRNANSKDKTKWIDSHMIRKQINIKSEVIDKSAQKDLFLRSDLWNQLVTQLLQREGFSRQPFLEDSSPSSFSNCLLVNRAFRNQNRSSETIFLIRRSIKIDNQPNLILQSQSSQINCLIAFSCVQGHKIQILWFAFVQMEDLQNKQHDWQDLFNILEALLQVQAIETFHGSTAFIEDDEQLMVAFDLLKEVIRRENQSFEHDVCIHPLITDELINNEPKIFIQQKETLKDVIRYLKQNFANQQLKILQQKKQCKEIVEKLMARKRFTWHSCQRKNQTNGFEFLPRKFYDQNNLKNLFMQVTHFINFKESITLHELPIVILNLFMSISETFSSKQSHRRESEVFKNEKNNFGLTPKTNHHIRIFQKIFHKGDYQFGQISFLPRIVIQLFYMHLSEAFECSLMQIPIEEVLKRKEIPLKDRNQIMLRVRLDTEEYENLQKENKLWKCECSMYDCYGIPCEHELLCALNYQTSLLREFSPKWKNPQSRNKLNHPHMVTDFLKKLLL